MSPVCFCFQLMCFWVDGVSISLLIISACFYSQFVRIFIASAPFSSLIILCVFLLPVRAYLHRPHLNLVTDHPCVSPLTVRAYLHRQHSIPATECLLRVSASSSCVSASGPGFIRLVRGFLRLARILLRRHASMGSRIMRNRLGHPVNYQKIHDSTKRR